MRSRPDGGWVEIDGALAFFDLTGFTKLTERLGRLGRGGAEYITDLLNTLFAGLIDEVFACDGDVLEFGGDAMVVLFTGEHHHRRAAICAAQILRFMAREGRVPTPAGNARVRLSCGIASGTQAYHLVGATRRALIVAGPVSTEMAELEAGAMAGEARINAAMAAALPMSWVNRGEDGTLRLRLSGIVGHETPTSRPTVETADGSDVALLLPTQLRTLADAGRRGGELKQVAMAFIRLTGTDDLLASADVAALNSRLREITDIIDHAAAELDVCWLETQAEANSVRWTLIAGAPDATERDADRLLRVLRRIVERTPVRLSMGANLGVVFVADLGHPLRCTFIVMGDATNLAARLMTRAAPGELIAGQHLVDAARSRFEFSPLEPFHVKGRRAPVRACLVGSVADDLGSASELTSGASLIGRQRELHTLLDVLRVGGVVELVGEPGMGKTRLWQEARNIEMGRPWLVMGAEPFAAASPYFPFRRLLRRLAGIGPMDDARTAGMAITRFVTATAPNLSSWLPLIADVIGAEVQMTDEVAALDSAFRGDRLRMAVADLVVSATDDGAVLVFEDVHWVDDASRALLEGLTNVLPGGCSLVLTRRPSSWSPQSAMTIVLEPISDDSAEELLLRELPAWAASDESLSRLRLVAAGNPLYLIELARSAHGGRSRTSDVFPESIERLLAARIDELPTASRALIRDAAALGSSTTLAFASLVLERPELIDADRWRRELGDLVVVDRDSVAFRHDLVRVAAYEGLSMRRRRALHRRAGDVIEAADDSTLVPDRVGALAFHAGGSGLPDRVARWNRVAAEAAISKGAMETAESLMSDAVRALRQIGADESEYVAASRRLAYVAERAGHAEASLEALAAAARGAGENERCLIAVDRARLLEKLGRYRSALATTARALESCTDSGIAGHLRLARASVRNYLGQWRECLALCDALLGDAELSADRPLIAQAHLLAEWCCACLGLPQRPAHEMAALSILTELDDSIGLANLLLNRGVSAWTEGRAADSIADFRASSERYERAGDVLGAALADNNLAEVLTLQFRLDAAETLLVRAQRVMRAANYPLGATGTISGLARIVAWRGDPEPAAQMQDEALAGFRQLHADDHIADALVRLVEIHVLRNDAAAALRTASEAHRALSRLPQVPVLPATLARLEARALLLQGDERQARDLFERAHALASADHFPYEIALAALGLAEIDGDSARRDLALGQLGTLGVLAPPPGSSTVSWQPGSRR